MSERWVLNASPFIVLARLNHENLFSSLSDEVVVPSAVAMEIQAGPAEDHARQVLTNGCFRIVETPPPPAQLLAWDLGAGETAVLSLALAKKGWTAIIDDGSARKCAQSLSIPVKGTLAVVILAKQRGLIASASDLLHSLREIGFRLDNVTIREALARTVGEEWPG